MRGSALAALALDLLAGEPPSAVHPTVGMGRWIARGRVTRQSRSSAASFVEGATLVGVGATLSGMIAGGADAALRALPNGPRAIARGCALKPAMSVRALLDAAREVERALAAGHLVHARELLGWHLVSRDTSELSASEVAAAAIESVAENFNDGVVAPLLAFRVGGLAGAYVFRFVNTADAMLGYRTPELEWLGKAAARLDDALAYVPARCAALLIALAAAFTGDSTAGAMRVALRDADTTASPNAGWPMAAMAGALGVRLEKRGHYRLNVPARPARGRDITRARHIVLLASAFAALATDAT